MYEHNSKRPFYVSHNIYIPTVEQIPYKINHFTRIILVNVKEAEGYNYITQVNIIYRAKSLII